MTAPTVTDEEKKLGDLFSKFKLITPFSYPATAELTTGSDQEKQRVEEIFNYVENSTEYVAVELDDNPTPEDIAFNENAKFLNDRAYTLSTIISTGASSVQDPGKFKEDHNTREAKAGFLKFLGITDEQIHEIAITGKIPDDLADALTTVGISSIRDASIYLDSKLILSHLQDIRVTDNVKIGDQEIERQYILSEAQEYNAARSGDEDEMVKKASVTALFAMFEKITADELEKLFPDGNPDRDAIENSRFAGIEIHALEDLYNYSKNQLESHLERS